MARTITLMTPEDGVTKKPNDLTFQWNISVNPVLTVNVRTIMPNEITIQWQPDPYAKEHKIYKNGELVITLPNTVANYCFTNLVPLTQYTFGVAAVDFLGQESDIVTTSIFTTEEPPALIDEIPQSLEIISMPTKTNYRSGESLDLSGMVVEAVYEPERRIIIPNEQLEISGFEPNVVGTQTIVIGYTAIATITTTFDITVLDITVTSIQLISPPTTSVYQIGEQINLNGMIVEAIYSDNSTGVLSHSALVISGFDSSAVSASQEVSVAYLALPALTFFVVIIDANGETPTAAEYFTFDAPTRTITGYNVQGGLNVVIPASFDVYGVDVPVERIGTDFKQVPFNGKNITRVVLPQGLIHIGANAFAGNLLTSIVLPESLKSIGQAAFYNNRLQGKLVLPAGLESLGIYAFERNLLTEVILPTAVTTITERAFGMNNFRSLTIPANIRDVGMVAFMDAPVTKITIGGGVQFAMFPVGETLVEGWNCLGSYSAKFVATYAAGGRVAGTYLYNSGADDWTKVGVLSIEIVEMPTKMTYFTGENLDPSGLIVRALYNDSSSGVIAPEELVIEGFDSSVAAETLTLTVNYAGFTATFSVTIVDRPASAETDFAFDNGTIVSYLGNETSIVIPAMIAETPVTRIGEGAFSNRSLATVVLPSTITRIDDDAFAGNELTSLSLPGNLTYIGKYAFQNNQIPGVLVVPNTVTSLGIGAFNNNKLSGVVLSNQLSIISNYAFYQNNLSQLALPPNVNYIGESAFGNSDIIRIEIGDNVSFGWYNNTLGTYSTSFITLYDSNRSAGTYEYESGAWIKTA